MIRVRLVKRPRDAMASARNNQQKKASATERSVNQVQGRGHFPAIQSDAIEV
jgi:hypothetical protein